MSISKPIPVRLSEEMIDRLDLAAKELGVDHRTVVIKLCLSSFLDYYEQTGWEQLKPEWHRIQANLDKRRKLLPPS